jgi:hypothetical protein
VKSFAGEARSLPIDNVGEDTSDLSEMARSGVVIDSCMELRGGVKSGVLRTLF